jgi:hypothetical protein
MVVKLTQEQADYLETFNGDKSRAFYFISRWGWGYNLSDGKGKTYYYDEKEPFEQIEIEKMLNALINGYEIDEPKFKFFNFSDITSFKKMYYAGKEKELTADTYEAKYINKDSKEYVALENLGFYKEEV